MMIERGAWGFGCGAIVIATTCLTGCESKVTQENYDKISNGMTEAQVFSILGKGDREDSAGMSISGAGVAGGSAPSSQTTYVWKDHNKILSVTFEGGKVVAKAMPQ